MIEEPYQDHTVTGEFEDIENINSGKEADEWMMRRASLVGDNEDNELEKVLVDHETDEYLQKTDEGTVRIMGELYEEDNEYDVDPVALVNVTTAAAEDVEYRGPEDAYGLAKKVT